MLEGLLQAAVWFDGYDTTEEMIRRWWDYRKR